MRNSMHVNPLKADNQNDVADFGGAEVSDIAKITADEYRSMIVLWITKLQRLENCAAAIIPYPGGIIAFGSREAVLSMLSDDGDVQDE